MGDTTLEGLRRILSNRYINVIDDSSLYPAGVMVLVFQKEGQHHVIFNKRTSKVEHHKGEISFPGGARDPEDCSMLDTALRETWEEMGINPKDIDVLGALDHVATRSNFVINPFVGTFLYPYSYVVSEAEIAEILEVPFSTLADPSNWREEVRMVDGNLQKSFSYVYENHLIYGATARIVTRFLEIAGSTLSPDKTTDHAKKVQ